MPVIPDMQLVLYAKGVVVTGLATIDAMPLIVKDRHSYPKMNIERYRALYLMCDGRGFTT